MQDSTRFWNSAVALRVAALGLIADRIWPMVLTTASLVEREAGAQACRWETVCRMKEKCPAVGEVEPGERREEEERKKEWVEQWLRKRVVVLWWTEGRWRRTTCSQGSSSTTG